MYVEFIFFSLPFIVSRCCIVHRPSLLYLNAVSTTVYGFNYRHRLVSTRPLQQGELIRVSLLAGRFLCLLTHALTATWGSRRSCFCACPRVHGQKQTDSCRTEEKLAKTKDWDTFTEPGDTILSFYTGL